MYVCIFDSTLSTHMFAQQQQHQQSSQNDERV